MENSIPDPPDLAGSDYQSYLTEEFPKAKPWDERRAEASDLSKQYRNTKFYKYWLRMGGCSTTLEFMRVLQQGMDEPRLKLKSARLCRVRHCPVCAWRRSHMWVARILTALPKIRADYPKARFILLTLTVQNPELKDLKATLKEMQRAFNNLQRRKEWPAIGWIRSTEVTRSKTGTAHPHFHCLLMVHGSYFKSKGYLSHDKWVQLWKSALKVSYDPDVDVRAVKASKKWLNGENEAICERFDDQDDAAFAAGVVETLKYSVKVGDLLGMQTEQDKDWLIGLTEQLHKTRAVAIGGVIKQYLSEQEPDGDEDETGEGDKTDGGPLFFGWREMVRRYVRKDY